MVRHVDDPNPKMPILVMPEEEIFREDTKPSASEIRILAAEFFKDVLDEANRNGRVGAFEVNEGVADQ